MFSKTAVVSPQRFSTSQTHEPSIPLVRFTDPPNDPQDDRLQFLNQEIVNLEEELIEALESWDLYESAALKYHILRYNDERSRMARESYRREREGKRAKEQTEERIDNILAEVDWCENKITKLRNGLRQARDQERRDLQALLSIYTSRRDNLNSSYKWCRQQIRAATIQPPKPDPKLGEIDFCEQKLDELQTQLRTARAEDHEDIKSLIRGYKKYWEQLMTESGRIRPPSADTPATPEANSFATPPKRVAVTTSHVSARPRHGRKEERRSHRKASRPRSTRPKPRNPGALRPIVVSQKILSLLNQLAALH